MVLAVYTYKIAGGEWTTTPMLNLSIHQENLGVMKENISGTAKMKNILSGASVQYVTTGKNGCLSEEL